MDLSILLRACEQMYTARAMAETARWDCCPLPMSRQRWPRIWVLKIKDRGKVFYDRQCVTKSRVAFAS